MKRFILLILIAVLVPFSSAFAQETGLFNHEIQFNGETRYFTVSVPETYNADEAYKLMICLHGLGDTGENYGSQLAPYWSALDSNLILIFPDGGEDVYSGFHEPAGDEEIILEAMNYAKDTYNIDENEIILQGFSYGGRSAFAYGLEHPDYFKGLLLNTPAFQGINDVLENEPHCLVYQLENASKIPMVFVHGSEDGGYIDVVRIMYEKVMENDGIAIRSLVEGLGHSIPPNDYTRQYLDYIDNPYAGESTAQVLGFEDPQITRSANFKPTIRFRNIGSNDITEAKIQLNYNGTKSEYTWTGNLTPYQHADVALDEIVLNDPDNMYSATILEINGNTEGVFKGIIKDGDIVYQSAAETLPYYDGFEDNNEDGQYWQVYESGNWISWFLMDEVSKTGQNSMYMLNMPLSFDNSGVAEALTTPYMDLSSATEPILSFDIAANYLAYGPPTYQEMEFVDTLEIQVSIDGGNNYQTIFRKNGKELATADEPIYNAEDVMSTLFYPTDDEWANISIPLDNYANEKNAIFKFNYISGLGGSIAIDNLEFKSAPVAVDDENELQDIKIYPNPVQNDLTYIPNDAMVSHIDIFAVSNNKLLISEDVNANAGNQYNINTNDLVNGVYLIRFTTNAGYKYSKFVVSK